MKQVVNSYSASLTFPQSPAWRERVATLVPPIPNYVWLAMLLLAATLLGSSTLWRAHGQMTTARNAQAVTNSRLLQAQTTNDEIKTQTHLIRTDAQAATQAAQERLHYVKANEIVIKTQ